MPASCWPTSTCAEGHVENAVAQLKEVVKLQPGDTLSAQLIAYYQPAGATQPPPAEAATNAAPAFEGKLAGTWTATPAKDAKIALAIKDDGKFNWDASGPGKPPTDDRGQVNLRRRSPHPRGPGKPGRRAGRQGGLAGCRPLHLPTRRRHRRPTRG